MLTAVVVTLAVSQSDATERYVFEAFLDSSQFNTPAQVAIDGSGNFWVADPLNNRIVLFPADRTTPKFISSLNCPSTVTGCVRNPWTLSGPTGVAVAPNCNVNCNIWVSDTGNSFVVEVDPTGTVVTFAGVPPSNVVTGCTPPITNCPSSSDPGVFVGPEDIALDARGNIYVSDVGNSRIQKFDSNGTFLNAWGSFCQFNQSEGTAGSTCNTNAPGAQATGDGQFSEPMGIALDSAENVYVADPFNNRIEIFDSLGNFLGKLGGLPFGSGDGQFFEPAGVAIDFQDSIYVADSQNSRIQKIQLIGTLTQCLGSPSCGQSSTTSIVTKGGSYGTGQGQFGSPQRITAYPKNLVQFCEFTNLLSGLPEDIDCRGVAVSDIQFGLGFTPHVELLSGRDDTDNDSITDEVDTQPTSFSNDFSNAKIPPGFTTTGSVLNRGDQTFVLYGATNPQADLIHIRAETFGGPTPLTLTYCVPQLTLSVPRGGGPDIHCSTPTVTAEAGPVGFKFVGIDGTTATATLNTGDSLSVDVARSEVICNAGTVTVLVGTKSVSLSPGQTTYADSTPPVIAAHPNIVVAATGPAGAVVTYTKPTATDLVDGTDPVTCIPAPGSTFPPGTTTVTCNATDSAGLQAIPTTFQVTVTDFSISVTPSSETIAISRSATYTLTLTPAYGFTGTIASFCTGGPITATCTFSPASVTLNRSSSATDTLTISIQKNSDTKGTFTFTVGGTYGTLSHSTTLSLTVKE